MKKYKGVVMGFVAGAMCMVTVTAMAVEADGDCMIMASVDVVGMSHEALEWAREKFHAICPEVDPNKLITNVTHTHTSLRIAAVKKPDTQVGLTLPDRFSPSLCPKARSTKLLLTVTKAFFRMRKEQISLPQRLLLPQSAHGSQEKNLFTPTSSAEPQ